MVGVNVNQSEIWRSLLCFILIATLENVKMGIILQGYFFKSVMH